MKAVFIERARRARGVEVRRPARSRGEARRGRRRHPRGKRQRRRLEGARRRSYPQTNFPYVLGRDFSGIVSAVGEGVSDFASAMPCLPCATSGQEGAYAEKIAIKAAIVAKKPAEPLACRCRRAGARRPHRAGRRRGHAEARGRRDHPDPGRGRRRRAASPSSSPSTSARASSPPPAPPTVDYVREPRRRSRSSTTTRRTSPRPSRAATPCSTRSAATSTQRSFAVLKPGGRAAFIASGAQAPKPDAATCSPCGRTWPATGRTWNASSRSMPPARCEPPEVRLFPLSEAVAAHKVSQARHLRGKLVFKVR